ncbi:MAG: cobyric acid synthase [Bacillota bacterium]
MNKSIMVQGTGSSVGKSIVVAGLCRVFNDIDMKVVPFKSQNMALNSYITKNGNEMGRAQVVQAEAARCVPNVKMNPILLKPSADKKAQVIIEGQVYKNMSAIEYDSFKPSLKQKIKKIYNDLSSQNDLVILEGAGSPAEINLRENDIVNMGMAEISDSPVILVGDIDKGGVFASLYGTYELLRPEEKERVKGVIINKFRGDIEILKPGLKQLEDLIGIPVLGVIPYSNLNIEEEDSVTRKFYKKDQNADINIEVLYLPHVSNFTDFDIFEAFDDVNLRYVMRGEKINNPDLLIIPGSKNTIEDLIYLRNSGLEKQIIKAHKNGSKIFGICGGYQMLGNSLEDPSGVESSVKKVNGIGLLDIDTVFEKEKTTTQIKGEILPNFEESLKEINYNNIKGYEIHMGKSVLNENSKPFLEITEKLNEKISQLDGATNLEETVFGTYIHGIFDSTKFTRNFINSIRQDKGLEKYDKKDIDSFDEFKEKEYDKLADILRNSLDIEKIKGIIENGV